jgi:predicted dehydrogenase
LAKKHDRILMVRHLLCYHPAVLKLKELIRAGELRRIQYIYFEPIESWEDLAGGKHPLEIRAS